MSGETLRARVTREGRLAPPEAAALGADVAEALAYAHGMGIVHRDVKPENIFAVGGRAVLADFGIAHIVGDASVGGGELTTDGTVLGTVSYMSPEQARGEPGLDGRSDLYSLGCVLYELLSGGPPFVAPTAWAILGKHMNEAPRPPRECGVAVPEGLEAIVLQLLAKTPGDRPAGAGEVARLLRAASHGGAPPAALTTADTGHIEAVTIGVIDCPEDDLECGPVAMAVRRAVASALSAVPGVRVMADEMRGGAADARVDAAASRAATVVEGSVRRSRNRMRITMRVVGPDGSLRWSQHADGAVDDVFALEDAVSETVARHFSTRTEMPRRPRRRGSRVRPSPIRDGGCAGHDERRGSPGRAGTQGVQPVRTQRRRCLEGSSRRSQGVSDACAGARPGECARTMCNGQPALGRGGLRYRAQGRVRQAGSRADLRRARG